LSRHVDEQKLEEIRSHATEGWYVADINGQQVILDKDGEPVDMVIVQQEMVDAIVEKWKADRAAKQIFRRRATKLLILLVLVLICYAAIGSVIWMIETGWGWIPALIGAAALVLIFVKGWWKP
jgi:hypothetical protein